MLIFMGNIRQIKNALIENSDIINNCFANDKFQKYAMTNRFYDALLGNKPQIVSKGSYSQELVEKNGLGLSINPNDVNIGDETKQWFDNYDIKELANNINKSLIEIKKMKIYL